MRVAYKVGSAFVIVWFIYIVYGFSAYDGIDDQSKLTILLLVSFLGFILFPIYFLTVYIFHYFRK